MLRIVCHSDHNSSLLVGYIYWEIIGRHAEEHVQAGPKVHSMTPMLLWFRDGHIIEPTEIRAPGSTPPSDTTYLILNSHRTIA